MENIDKEFDAEMLAKFNAIIKAINEFELINPDRQQQGDVWTIDFVSELRTDVEKVMMKWLGA